MNQGNYRKHLIMRRLAIFCAFFIFLGFFCLGKSQNFTAEPTSQNYSDAEWENHEAIAKIHSHLDDDRDGNVDFEESNEFIQGELEVTDEERLSHFHGSDNRISVDDLWRSWKASAVYNWTNEDVIDWLVKFVHLPDYEESFINSRINGSMLPRLAAQENGLLQNDLGIKDVKHRKKIALRAMDIVLFGPPPTGHNFFKDIVLALSVFIATAGCWFAVIQKRRAKVQMDQIMRDMKVLHQAEENLQELQNRLNQAEIDHQNALEDKINLEARLEEELQASKQESHQFQNAGDGTDHHLRNQLRLAEEELAQVHRALKMAQKDLECHPWRAPSALRQWLQITYEKETKHFQNKRASALKQMQEAKEACERIKRKRNSMIGSFRLAHDLSIDEVDEKILSARAALAEVTNELEERQHRWSQIESLCGLQIVTRGFIKSSEDTSVGARPRTSSAIAQALANVANIGGVGSGRKISSHDSPWMMSSQGGNLSSLKQRTHDLPPTYSSTMASINSASSHLSHPSKKTASVQLRTSPSASSFSGTANHFEATPGEKGMMNGHHAPVQSHSQQSNTTDGTASGKGSGIIVEDAVVSVNSTTSLQTLSDTSLENQAVTRSSNANSATGARSRKRLNWFGSAKKVSLNDSDSFTADNDENTRRRVKWLWRSAVQKSSVHKLQHDDIEAKSDRKPKHSSNEKLKAG